MPLIIDGHLDIAMNALRYERDQRLPVAAIRLREVNLTTDEPGTCTTTVDEMRRAGVPVCVTTVIARKREKLRPERREPRYGLDHPTQDMAHAAAMGQLAYYNALERQGHVRILRTAGELEAHWSQWLSHTSPKPPPLGLIITMEGGDPLVTPDEVHLWWSLGLRSLMLAHFQQSCYAYGTPSAKEPAQGPLTDAGRELLAHMAELKMPLDLTHLCDMSFFEAIDAFGGAVYASHSNCRLFADTQRQLSDRQIRLIVERGGVIGVVMCNNMISGQYTEKSPKSEVGFDLLAQHIDHICQLAGSAEHVAIGSDLDGGFGAEDCPRELDTVADLHRIEEALADRGFKSADVVKVMHGNWLRFWKANLPGGGERVKG
jgi:membrane dipeptidase